MSDTVILAIIAGVTQIALALIGLLTMRRVRKLENAVNGRMDQLMGHEKAVSHAEGVAHEVARDKSKETP